MFTIKRREAIKKSLLYLSATYSFTSLGFILNGCNDSLNKKTLFFINTDQENVIADIADIFIPRTDTPGAKDLKLEIFIISMIRDCFGKEIKESFMSGLEDFTKKIKLNYGKDFLTLDIKEKENIILKEDRLAFNLMSLISSKVLHHLPTFFQLMKELTVLGYCTSEVGAKQELAFLPVPGQYHGCLSLKKDQKAWAISK